MQKQIKPHELKITSNLLKHVKEARSRYLSSQRERDLEQVKGKRQVEMQEITDEIVNTKEHISLLEATVSQLKKEADLFGFEAEKNVT